MNASTSHQLILASESPRRRDLLQEAGFLFTVHPIQISENLKENLTVEEQIQELARRKATAALDRLEQDLHRAPPRPWLVMAADTMVVLDQRPIGKPSDPQDAVLILRRLSGRPHQVMTGVSIRDTHANRFLEAVITSEVIFRVLSEEEIWSYVQTGEPLDKAGAYGIQGLGGRLVSHFRGSYTNIIGLPMEWVTDTLKGYPTVRKTR